MDISLSLAKLAKQKGFKPVTVKFYSDKKNGSRNSSEPKSFNTLKADEQYGEMYACTDIEVLKKWVDKKVGNIGDGEEGLIEALNLYGVESEIEPIVESPTEVKAKDTKEEITL
jgi:hypothetical protein